MSIQSSAKTDNRVAAQSGNYRKPFSGKDMAFLISFLFLRTTKAFQFMNTLLL